MPFDCTPVILDLEHRKVLLDEAIVLLRSLYGTPSIPAAKADGPRKYQKLPKVAAPKEDEGGRSSPVQDALLVALKAGPMTSIEAFEALKKAGVTSTAGSVYQLLRVLLAKGSIGKTENDEGRNAWKLAT
jgi:hypothetical protein